MNVTLKQISSLEKVRTAEDVKNEVSEAKIFLGERYSYQVVLQADEMVLANLCLESSIKDCVKVYSVHETVMDLPLKKELRDEDYLTDQPGLMPDLLVPMEEQNNKQVISSGLHAFWVEVCIPENFKAGSYDITLRLSGESYAPEKTPYSEEITLKAEVVAKTMPKQELLFTQWFHVDCIASAHDVAVYSEEHWEWIERYMKLAAELGINMILTPVITPPLDTAIGTHRMNTQLLKIEKKNGTYTFDFTRLKRFIDMCLKYGIKNFEISHLYSQWGAKCAPNIFVMENGEQQHMFGWHVAADDASYVDFLQQMLPALVAFLEEQGIAKNCYFHISDEPVEEHLEAYKNAQALVRPLLGECKTMDALSHYDFYKQGLVVNPVCGTDAIATFIENKADNLWAYTCCGQAVKVGNRFFAMPSYRNRILGLQLYKYSIKGFLQWGYNFYYSSLSHYEVNPYVTSSSDRAFQSGDAFSVYPDKNGPKKSLRAIVFFDALQDILVCRMLEEYIGHDAVVELIDREAGMDLTFSDYPRNSEFIINLMAKMKDMIKSYQS